MIEDMISPHAVLGAFLALTSMDAGVNCVRAQCKEVKYLYVAD